MKAQSTQQTLVTMTAGVLLAVLAVMTAPVAQAVIMQANSSSTVNTGFDSTISSTDLINAGQPSLASTSQSGVVAGSISDSNDGSTNPTNFGSGLVWVTTGTTLTYQLNLNPGTGGNALGYDITGINTITGYNAGGAYVSQAWDLQITTLLNPTFTTIASSVTNTASGSTESTKISLTDSTGVIGHNVTGIQFVWESASPILHEIDVFGSASPAPEPASAAMLLGLAPLLARRRRRA